MAFVHRQTELVRTVPGATVRLVAVTTGVEIRPRFGRCRFAHVSPRSIEVAREGGRVDVVRARDLDLASRIAIVVIGAVASRHLRKKGSKT